MEEERNFVWVQLKYVFFWNITVMEVKFCVCVCVYVRTYFVYTALNTYSMWAHDLRSYAARVLYYNQPALYAL
jgi:hypothetical protein